MYVFLAIGAVGLLLLAVSLLLDDVLGGLFDFDFDGGGWLSGPVIAAFLAAFGFGAALTLQVTDVSVAVATLAGLGAGVVLGGAAGAVVRAVVAMPTDATPTTEGLVGLTGTVVTAIPEGGLGEVLIRRHGQPAKLAARAATAVAAGTSVTVTAATSATSVVVEPTAKASPPAAGV